MSTATPKLKPHEKMPEHHCTDKTPETKEEKIDAQMEDSFPASDPPSFSGGNHIIGAPTGRESEAPSPERPRWSKPRRRSRTAAPRRRRPIDRLCLKCVPVFLTGA